MQQLLPFPTARRRLTGFAMIVGVVFTAFSAQADVKRIPVDSDRVSKLMEACLLSGGDNPGTAPYLPVFCCATNSEGTLWCITCFSGTSNNPDNCDVTTKARGIVRGRQPQAPVTGPSVTAPTPTPTPNIRDRLRGQGFVLAPSN